MGKMTAKPISAAAVVLLCCFLVIAEGEKLKTFRQEYGPFNQTHYQYFEVEKPATISNDALQVTPDSASANFILTNLSGRVLLKQSFKLWADDIGSNSSRPRVASFNTSFLINVFRPKNETPGEGLAFVIAPDLDLPANSSGQFLGLTNSSIDGRPANKLVAVELDTCKQEFDPDDNHVGININSVRSIMTEPLAPHNITIAPIGARFYNVWVDYDGDNMVMQVYIAEQAEKEGPTPPKPRSPILSAWDLNLRDHVNQYSYFGFSASTGNTTQLNCVLRWNLTVNYFTGGEDKWLKVVLGAGVPVLVLLLIGAIGFVYYCHRRRVALSNPNLVGALKSLPGTPREFEFRALKKATNRFDERHKLGQGGFGVVYRGVLVKENMEIAVKWFSRESIKGQDDFLAELTIINRLRHKHLVKLLGWCYKYGKLLLVYEYMPNGSLDQHLFAGPNVAPLSWELRYKIIAGVASALHYLHNEYDQRVVHRDLKASNIMLDSNFNARLGDFGLARVLDNEKTSYAEAEGVLGTMGYIAPECFHTGKATQQSDVYAFGAVILEVVCGQRPGAKIAGFQFLVDWVWLLHRDGRLHEAVDQRLGDDYVPEEAQRLLLLGLACSHPTASERPKTQAIVQIISGTVPVPIVPPFKPAFVWPASGPIDLDLDSGSVGTASSVTTSHFGSGWTPQYLSRESYTGYSDSMV
ncbi:putative L-type lectin-domain containing receptor kinase S.5 [Sesamum alatum]|uniref:L-type lectin-domain containing receptor kinase S.5 n=1 Tax=Sesamum alatum TaxID=300844 RepID=A0AAE1YHN2_9LAMI|nr:putative L-type lectin-domain containing receptor kinase S.5 [Sesamum alatum]